MNQPITDTEKTWTSLFKSRFVKLSGWESRMRCGRDIMNNRKKIRKRNPAPVNNKNMQENMSKITEGRID